MNNKVLVVKKEGYNIWGTVNPVNSRLQNFSVSGPGMNPTHTYPYLVEAEQAVKRLVGRKN
jgi:hypothetical protein